MTKIAQAQFGGKDLPNGSHGPCNVRELILDLVALIQHQVASADAICGELLALNKPTEEGCRYVFS